MRRALVPLVLLLGILAVSTASLFIRYAQHEAPSLVIAAARLGIAAALLLPFAAARHRQDLAALSGRERGLALLAGTFVALHFASWITSLEYTTVASSAVLVTTTPIWVAVLSPLVLGERVSRATAAGIGLALAGGVAIALDDAGVWHRGGVAAALGGRSGGRALFGDLLALFGAWMMAGYLLVGRRLRARLTLLPYVTIVYGAGAIVLIVAVAVARAPLAFGAPTWGWLVLLALVPQLIGHSSFNWSLRHVPTSLVAIALLCEPIAASALAYAFLGERPGTVTIAGAGVLLLGVAIAARGTVVEEPAG